MCFFVNAVDTGSALAFVKKVFPDVALDEFVEDAEGKGIQRFSLSPDDPFRSGWYEVEDVSSDGVCLSFGVVRPVFADMAALFVERIIKGSCSIDPEQFLSCPVIDESGIAPCRQLSGLDGVVLGTYMGAYEGGMLKVKAGVKMGSYTGVISFGYEDLQHYFLIENTALSNFFEDNNSFFTENGASLPDEVLKGIKATFPYSEISLDHVVLDGRPHRFYIGNEAIPSGMYKAKVLSNEVLVTVGQWQRVPFGGDAVNGNSGK